jgi:hypothetical protein
MGGGSFSESGFLPAADIVVYHHRENKQKRADNQKADKMEEGSKDEQRNQQSNDYPECIAH